MAALSSEGGRVLSGARFAFPGPNSAGLVEAEVDGCSRALRAKSPQEPLLGRVEWG